MTETVGVDGAPPRVESLTAGAGISPLETSNVVAKCGLAVA